MKKNMKVIAIFLVVYAACTFLSGSPKSEGLQSERRERLPTQTRLRSVLPSGPSENPELEG